MGGRLGRARVCGEARSEIPGEGPLVRVHVEAQVQPGAGLGPEHFGKQDLAGHHIDGEVPDDLAQGNPVAVVVLSKLGHDDADDILADGGRSRGQGAGGRIDGQRVIVTETERSIGAVSGGPGDVGEGRWRWRVGGRRGEGAADEDVADGKQKAVRVGVGGEVVERKGLALADIGLGQLNEAG